MLLKLRLEKDFKSVWMLMLKLTQADQKDIGKNYTVADIKLLH